MCFSTNSFRSLLSRLAIASESSKLIHDVPQYEYLEEEEEDGEKQVGFISHVFLSGLSKLHYSNRQHEYPEEEDENQGDFINQSQDCVSHGFEPTSEHLCLL